MLFGKFKIKNGVLQKYKGKNGDAVIPSSVKRIDHFAFAGNTGLKRVVIPDSVTVIGFSAFSGCTALTSVAIPAGVKKIENYAFAECAGLERAVIPEGVNTIGTGAFRNCTALAEIEIPKSVTVIECGAFQGCSRLAKVVIRDGVPAIGFAAFYGCASLSGIEIPKSVTVIEGEAFSGCTRLERITIPKTVAKVGREVFSGCNALRAIEVAEGNPVYRSAGNCLIEIESKTLIAGCKNSVIPEDGSVTVIGGKAFHNLSALSALVIPEGVTEIKNWAFDGCGLTALTIPASVEMIEEGAFLRLGALCTIEVAEGNPAYHSAGNCLIETESKTLIAGCNGSVIPEDGSVVRIGKGAFSGRIGLTGITIPASVESVEIASFSDCGALCSIEVAEDNPVYRSVGNCLIETGDGVLVAGCKNSVIPDDGSVTEIPPSAFSGRVGLTEIAIPDGVRIIGDGAFTDCTDLTTVTVPASVESFGRYVFDGCPNLKQVFFKGTTDQWDLLRFGAGLDDKTDLYPVTCSNGKYVV